MVGINVPIPVPVSYYSFGGWKASLFGVPLPLCSCGVIPVAVELRKQGAGRGATTSFLISTPETGVDSMLLTYALMGPVMTVARPVAAFVAAIRFRYTSLSWHARQQRCGHGHHHRTGH